jgi:hypothetical protein
MRIVDTLCAIAGLVGATLLACAMLDLSAYGRFLLSLGFR